MLFEKRLKWRVGKEITGLMFGCSVYYSVYFFAGMLFCLIPTKTVSEKCLYAHLHICLLIVTQTILKGIMINKQCLSSFLIDKLICIIYLIFFFFLPSIQRFVNKVLVLFLSEYFNNSVINVIFSKSLIYFMYFSFISILINVRLNVAWN